MAQDSTLLAIGDTITVDIPVKAEARITITGFTEDIEGLTNNATVYREFRWTTDGGLFWTEWKEMTAQNLSAEALDVHTEATIQLRYTRRGTDETNPIIWNSITFEGEANTNTYNTPTIDDSIFADVFPAEETKKLAANLFKKLYFRGIVPQYIIRAENRDEEEDADYIAYARTVGHFFAMLIRYFKRFDNFYNDEELMREYVRQYGVYFDESNITLEQLQYLTSYLYDEIRKRGTAMIFKREGDELADGSTNPIDGEFVRLFGSKEYNELLYELIPTNKTGWCLGQSSPLWRGTSDSEQLNKTLEDTEDFQDLDNFLHYPGAGEMELMEFEGKNVLKMGVTYQDIPGGVEFPTNNDSYFLSNQGSNCAATIVPPSKFNSTAGRTCGVTFKTGDDVTTKQHIWGEPGWMFTVNGGRLYFGATNATPPVAQANLMEVEPNTLYQVIVSKGTTDGQLSNTAQQWVCYVNGQLNTSAVFSSWQDNSGGLGLGLGLGGAYAGGSPTPEISRFQGIIYNAFHGQFSLLASTWADFVETAWKDGFPQTFRGADLKPYEGDGYPCVGYGIPSQINSVKLTGEGTCWTGSVTSASVCLNQNSSTDSWISLRGTNPDGQANTPRGKYMYRLYWNAAINNNAQVTINNPLNIRVALQIYSNQTWGTLAPDTEWQDVTITSTSGYIDLFFYISAEGANAAVAGSTAVVCPIVLLPLDRNSAPTEFRCFVYQTAATVMLYKEGVFAVYSAYDAEANIWNNSANKSIPSTKWNLPAVGSPQINYPATPAVSLGHLDPDNQADTTKGYVVDAGLDYEVVFDFLVPNEGAGGDLRFGVEGYDLNGRRLLDAFITSDYQTISGDFVTEELAVFKKATWYRLRGIIHAYSTAQIVGQKTNIGRGTNLTFNNRFVRYILPYIILNQGGDGEALLYLWNYKIRPSVRGKHVMPLKSGAEGSHSLGFLECPPLFYIYARNNNNSLSENDILDFIDKYLLPYNVTTIIQYLSNY